MMLFDTSSHPWWSISLCLKILANRKYILKGVHFIYGRSNITPLIHPPLDEADNDQSTSKTKASHYQKPAFSGQV
jgi:hypothetical protein